VPDDLTTARNPAPADRRLMWATMLAVLSLLAGFIGWRLSGPGQLLAMATAGALAAGAGLALIKSGARRHLDGIVASAVANSSEAAFITRLPNDPATPFVFANPAFHKLFGGSGHPAGSLAGIAGLFAGNDESGDELARLTMAVDAGGSDHAEIQVFGASGAIEWRRISVVPFTPKNSAQRYALWQANDITANREMEATRHREEELLADFLDNLPAGFFSADSRGVIRYANSVFNDWLGVTADEIRSGNIRFSDFVVAGSADAAVLTSVAGINGDVTLRGPGGSLFKACLLQSEHVDSGGDMDYSRSVLLRELTWRGEAGFSAAIGNAMGMQTGTATPRLRWLFEEAPVGIVLLDLHGDVTDANRAFLKLLGVHNEAVIGRPFSEQISKEDRGDVAAQLSKVVMGIMPASHLEVRMPAMGERELVASLYASRLEDDFGEVSGLALHFIDTTEHKNLEVQFAQSQKMQAIGQLAGGVAHDFNNLLTAMIGFSDLLLTRHGPEDPSFSDIMQIKQNANRATNLVRQLLAFSRQQTLEPVVLEVSGVISDLSHLLGRLIGENIELTIDHQRDLWLLRVDRGQFDQVVINLAVNARDAMPGGGTLSIRSANISINQPVQRSHDVMAAGDYVLIEVGDTGTGIAKEDLSRIFEPFFSTKEVGEGTGLGLSTVYGIIHQTNGYIFVDSAPGEGTTFSIYLPRHEGAPGEMVATVDGPPRLKETAAKSTGDLTGEGTVLLVEDEDAVRMFGARALRNKGYKVLEARDGEQALDVINSSDDHIDLIISDVVMPGMNGHTLVNLVRHELPHLKIILMSGYSEDVFADQVEGDTGIEFLAKPFSLKDLASKVKDVLAG